MAVNIPGRNPHGMRAGRRFPTSGSPSVGMAVPAVIPANPHVITARCDAAMLDNGPRRSDSHDNFRSLSGAYDRGAGEQTGQQ